MQSCWFFSPMKSKKGLAHDVMYMTATHARHFMSQTWSKCQYSCQTFHVTNLVKMAVLMQDISCYKLGQNASTHGCVFVTFKHQFSTNQTVNQLTNCCECIFCSIFTSRTYDAALLGVPLKKEKLQQVLSVSLCLVGFCVVTHTCLPVFVIRNQFSHLHG